MVATKILTCLIKAITRRPENTGIFSALQIREQAFKTIVIQTQKCQKIIQFASKLEKMTLFL